MRGTLYTSLAILFAAIAVASARVQCDPAEQFACNSRVFGLQCCYKGGSKYCDPASGCTQCPNSGEVSCDGRSCVSLLDNPNFCGICSHRCPDGWSCCDGSCYDLQNNTDNCGRCSYNCQPSQLCCKGMCVDDDQNLGVCPYTR
jgi:hypothetical protein